MSPRFRGNRADQVRKPNCHCTRGDRRLAHYHATCDRGVRFRKYVRRDRLAEVVAACEAHRELQAQLHAGRDDYKRNLANVRELIRSIRNE